MAHNSDDSGSFSDSHAPKRQKREPPNLIYGAYRRSESLEPGPVSSADKLKESTFAFESLPDCGPSSDNFISNITNYIAIGSLRVYSENVHVPGHIWAGQDFWGAFSLPRDIFNRRDGPFLSPQLQDGLFKSLVLSSYEMLFNNGFIRMEFKINDNNTGQVRVYLLDNHLVHKDAQKRGREIARATKQLMREVDVSNLTWAGKWSLDTPVLHIHPNLNPPESRDDETVLGIFNTLPSPTPDPTAVADGHARSAMKDLLGYKYLTYEQDEDFKVAGKKAPKEVWLPREVFGLTTELYPYQRRSAALMLQKEASPGHIVDPRLVKLVDKKGVVWYCDPDVLCYRAICYYLPHGATPLLRERADADFLLQEAFANREPRIFEGTRGGILAENMGLGKTLICLALILATRDGYSQTPPECSAPVIPIRKTTGTLLQMVASAIGRHGIPWKIALAVDEADGLELRNGRKALETHPGQYTQESDAPQRATRAGRPDPKKILLSTTTLVVVPANLLQQWMGEIKKHTTGLKVLALVAPDCVIPPAEVLLQYDILLFTKFRFASEAKVGESPLFRIHFKRIIFDEGHTVGNSSASAQTEAYKLINSLKITSRWVVSGTPTRGLYSTEESNGDASNPLGLGSDESESINSLDQQMDMPKASKLAVERERMDLVKLGNIAVAFLQARPWTPDPNQKDSNLWGQYVLQARHGAKSRGSAACLRSTLEGLIIKHRLSEVEADVVLPPLYQKVVKLEPCLQSKLILNLFSINIITNAITSERKDVDYFFHPKQQKHLQSLVSNLREASFFWSGFEVDHLQSTIEVGQTYLAKEGKVASEEDLELLRHAVEMGKEIVSNTIFHQLSHWHEIPLFVQNDFPDSIRTALSLNNSTENPTMVSASMLFKAQRFVHRHGGTDDILDGLASAARRSFKSAEKARQSENSQSRRTTIGRIAESSARKTNMNTKAVGRNVKSGYAKKPRSMAKRMNFSPLPGSPAWDELPRHGANMSRNSTMATSIHTNGKSNVSPYSIGNPSHAESQSSTLDIRTLGFNEIASEGQDSTKSPVETLKTIESPERVGSNALLDTARIISTASTKLTYLLDSISTYQETEKILVFYESSNVAYYIAQCLECMNINHLIYAKELSTEKRAEYVVTFNSTPTFRVLLMDVSQAAFGLDMSSASRVFFINPVFSRQMEVQAVKRAHRIGQHKPVYVETLVLVGSIEEAIVDRREQISIEQHQKYKSILDDRDLYEWILNAKLLPMRLDGVSNSNQMARLATTQKVFGHSGFGEKLDTDIVKLMEYARSPEPVISPAGDLGDSDQEDTGIISAYTVLSCRPGRHNIPNLAHEGLRLVLQRMGDIENSHARQSGQQPVVSLELGAMRRRLHRELLLNSTDTSTVHKAWYQYLSSNGIRWPPMYPLPPSLVAYNRPNPTYQVPGMALYATIPDRILREMDDHVREDRKARYEALLNGVGDVQEQQDEMDES